MTRKLALRPGIFPTPSHTITEFQTDKAKTMEKILEKKCNHICEELPLSSYQSFLARLRIDFFLYTFTQSAINSFRYQNSNDTLGPQTPSIATFMPPAAYLPPQESQLSIPPSEAPCSSSSKSSNTTNKLISPIPPASAPLEMVPESAPTTSSSSINFNSSRHSEEEYIGIFKELHEQYAHVYKLTDKDPGFESYLRSWIERYSSFLYVNAENLGLQVLDLDLILAVYSVRSRSVWAVNLIRCTIEGLSDESALNHILNLIKGVAFWPCDYHLFQHSPIRLCEPSSQHSLTTGL